jgi:SAM-dependent methyltransferase
MPLPIDSDHWNRRYSDPQLIWTSEPNRFLVAEAGSLSPGRALDAACGEGRNAVWLAERGWDVTGVDFSDVGLEKARSLAQSRGVDAHWQVADLNDYTPESEAFDLVIMLYLHVRAASRQAIVGTLSGAVASGGTFLLVAHDSSNLERGYGGPQDLLVLYSPADVVADLAGAGLRVERADIVERPVDTPDGERIALDALVRARRDE